MDTWISATLESSPTWKAAPKWRELPLPNHVFGGNLSSTSIEIGRNSQFFSLRSGQLNQEHYTSSRQQSSWKNMLLPRKLTWNRKITQLKRTIIFQTSIFFGSMLIFQGVLGIFHEHSFNFQHLLQISRWNLGSFAWKSGPRTNLLQHRALPKLRHRHPCHAWQIGNGDPYREDTYPRHPKANGSSYKQILSDCGYIKGR